ncbi:biotin carboxylase [Bacillaceae bacterium JMAK1]|nr:biotin carboxylase [Bacillaceae bacterium JMAK1]
MNIKKKDSTAILNALSGGVVPSRGLQYVMVGRQQEADQIMKDLANIKEGASFVKFFIGDFGSGKSFVQALIQQIAFKERFIVSKADFTPERRLYASDGKALAMYTEMMNNLSTSTKPDGNALGTILDKWISDVQRQVVEERGYNGIDLNNRNYLRDVKQSIEDVVNQLDSLVGGYDLSRILTSYYDGFVMDDSEKQRNALRWLRGEFTTKTEARQDLGVREIIDDHSYYDYIKVFSQFFRKIGYSGLVINFDEAINLYKITHTQSREKNYETILKIYNDTLQGNLEGLYLTFGGTPTFLEDERKGLFSYAALKRRLQTNRYETAEFRDLSQPVITLTPLKHDETFVLVNKIKEIHAIHYKYEDTISEVEVMQFINEEYNRPGAEDHLTPGDVVRHWVQALDMIHQNPEYDRTRIFGEVVREEKKLETETPETPEALEKPEEAGKPEEVRPKSRFTTSEV